MSYATNQWLITDVKLECDDMRAARKHQAAEISTKFLVTCVHSEQDSQEDADNVEMDAFSDSKRRRYLYSASASSVIQC